jgi:selenocysteine lyase/cysteine desulfurase
MRNQHLIRTSLPTSHGYRFLAKPEPIDKSPFAYLFEFVATIDYTPYLCIQAALDFRQHICGGEAAIRMYCRDLARTGGQRVAEILETEVMGNGGKSFNECCFANIKLPLTLKGIAKTSNTGPATSVPEDVSRLKKWLNLTAFKEFDTYLQIDSHAGFLWVRLSAQIYLELANFEWVGWKLKELCRRAEGGEYRDADAIQQRL